MVGMIRYCLDVLSTYPRCVIDKTKGEPFGTPVCLSFT